MENANQEKNCLVVTDHFTRRTLPAAPWRRFQDVHPKCLGHRTVAIPLLLLQVFFGSPVSRAAEMDLLTSPDGRIRASIEFPSPASLKTPAWSATFRNQTILTNCTLSLQTADVGELLAGARILERKHRSVDERIPIPFGKADHADDRFREVHYLLETPNKGRIVVIFRCYNDAVALRYELPEEGKSSSVIVINEATSFRLAGNPTAYAQYLENFKTSHEHNVKTVPYGDLPRGQLLDMPLTFSWPDQTFVAITEAALRHYAGMALMRMPNMDTAAGDALVCQLTPRPDGTKVVRPLPMRTPWRVALIGDRPGALLESTTLFCLNDPSVIPDISWIKPGKITFHWWNGDVYDGQPGEPILSFGMAKKYIDFCASNGLPIHAMSSTEKTTSPWYYQSKPGVAPGPDTDVTRPREDFDLARIRQYADSKNVRLWTWVHQGALRGRVEEAFAAFEKLGWRGMMVDFFDHDDQETVEFAESVLEAAARHHILIHLHGIWKPTGWERTYPNLMNHEGALNLEYLKWSDQCPPEHDLMMAFTRLIAGPMDYHLGGFRAVRRDQFKPRHIAPVVLGTRCHMLALYVCFDNPTPMIADYPTAYEGQPGFDFLQIVPTWWDETRVLVAQIGTTLVTARRQGNVWYVGGISAGNPRTVNLPLSFLSGGNYQAQLWQDASDAEIDPNHLTTATRQLTAHDTLKVSFGRDGGFVARFQPEN